MVTLTVGGKIVAQMTFERQSRSTTPKTTATGNVIAAAEAVLAVKLRGNKYSAPEFARKKGWNLDYGPVDQPRVLAAGQF